VIKDVLSNRALMAVIVVGAVPFVLAGYILLVEAIVRRVPKRWGGGIRPLLWIAPALTFLGVFLVYPTIKTILRSFQNRRGDAYVGLENYRWFFTREDTLISLRNTAIWVVLLTTLVVGLGLGIAVLVDKVKYEGAVKTVVFLPMAISFVAAGVIWKLMYDIDPSTGTLNAGLQSVGVEEPTAFLSNPPLNNVFLIIVGVWMLTGFAMVILSAGLKGISTELIEAAQLDGANAWEVFRLIVLPLLAPTIAVVATTIVIIALKTFDIVYVMTNGNFRTEVIASSMYREIFNNSQQGRAAAIAVVLTVAIIPVMILNVRRFRQQEEVR
jgi:alpha-glucoside transport system permease protein